MYPCMFYFGGGFFLDCAGSLMLHGLFSSCDEQRLLIEVASLVEHRL